ncbi:MFS transporter [Cohnella sp. REN36]|uniref:MFS transporter n=1 Tax=Cohnella sp. REN36 TaxID=2887347 RepID=UPI001D152AAB|nr:MFS transporter [Cohnella sp. REN36]MCC3372739.1 MFS transporter [Cohnella sp. REN36]
MREEGATPGRAQAWIGLGVLWIVGFVGALSRFIMAYYQSRITEDLATGRSFISLAWSSNLLIAAVCAPVGGWLSDRYGPKRVILASATFGLLGTSIVYFGHMPFFFFLGYGIVSGLGGISVSATYMLLFGWFDRHRAKASALLSSASSIGLAVCTPLFVWNRSLTWEDAFLLSASLGLFVTLPMVGFLVRPARQGGAGREPAAADAETSASVPAGAAAVRSAAARKRWRLTMAIVGFGLFTCGFNMGTVEMNLVAIHEGAKVLPGMIALSMSVLGIMEIAGSLAFGFLMDGMSKRLALVLLYGIRVAGFALLYLHLPATPVGFAVAFGITYLGAVPGGIMVAGEEAAERGKQVGYLLMCHQAGGIVGALAGGMAFDAFGSYQALIATDIAMCVAAAGGYFLLHLRSGNAATRLPFQTPGHAG